MMKRLIMMSLVLMGLHTAWAGETIDSVVATVNDTVITHSELQHAVQITQKQLVQSGMTLPPEDLLRKQILNQLINRKLQLDLAKEANMTVSDKELEDAINRIAAQNKMSLLDFYQKVTTQGMTKTEYKKKLQEEMLIQKIQQEEVADKIIVNPQEIDDYIHSKIWQASVSKEYHLEDILISLPEEPSTTQINDAKRKADSLLQRIHQGMNFRTAALEASGGTQALQGGDLGWRKLPEIPTAFADQVLQMKENEIIGPIQTANGFHILRLVATRDIGKKMDPKTERQQVAQYIFQGKLDEGLQSWIMKLRGSAYINLDPAHGKF